MGLHTQFAVFRFVSGGESEQFESEVRAMLAGFFKATTTHDVQDAFGHYYSPEEALQELSLHMVKAQRMESKEKNLPRFEEQGQQLDQLSSATRIDRDGKLIGISFGIDKKTNPKSRWNLFLRRGALPMLELRTFHGNGFQPNQQIETDLIKTDAVVWIDGFLGFGGKKYIGTDDNLYLLLKWFKLRLGSQNHNDNHAVAAGLDLRQKCREISRQETSSENHSTRRLSSSGSKTREFEQNFDQALLGLVGNEPLNLLLKTMGTDLQKWLGNEPQGEPTGQSKQAE